MGRTPAGGTASLVPTRSQKRAQRVRGAGLYRPQSRVFKVNSVANAAAAAAAKQLLSAKRAQESALQQEDNVGLAQDVDSSPAQRDAPRTASKVATTSSRALAESSAIRLPLQPLPGANTLGVLRGPLSHTRKRSLGYLVTAPASENELDKRKIQQKLISAVRKPSESKAPRVPRKPQSAQTSNARPTTKVRPSVTRKMEKTRAAAPPAKHIKSTKQTSLVDSPLFLASEATAASEEGMVSDSEESDWSESRTRPSTKGKQKAKSHSIALLRPSQDNADANARARRAGKLTRLDLVWNTVDRTLHEQIALSRDAGSTRVLKKWRKIMEKEVMTLIGMHHDEVAMAAEIEAIQERKDSIRKQLLSLKSGRPVGFID